MSDTGMTSISRCMSTMSASLSASRPWRAWTASASRGQVPAGLIFGLVLPGWHSGRRVAPVKSLAGALVCGCADGRSGGAAEEGYEDGVRGVAVGPELRELRGGRAGVRDRGQD